MQGSSNRRDTRRNSASNINNHRRTVSQITRDGMADEETTRTRISHSKSYKHRRESSMIQVRHDQLDEEYDMLIPELQAMIQGSSGRHFSKVERIRISQWLSKLSIKPNNAVWKTNRNFYLQVLQQMLEQGVLLWPFINVPEDGALPKLTIYDVPYKIKQGLEGKARQKLVIQEKRSQRMSCCKSRYANRQLQGNQECKRNAIHKREPKQKCNTKSITQKKNNRQSLAKQLEFNQQYQPVQLNTNSNKFASINHKLALTNNKLALTNNKLAFTNKSREHWPQLTYDQVQQMCEKENIELNSNGGQLSRRLFDNKESAQSKTSKNELVEKLDPSVDKWNISGMQILVKVLKLLGKHYDQLSTRSNYRHLVESIVKLGQRMHLDLKSIDLDENIQSPSNDSSRKSQNSLLLKTQQIKQTISQTDIDTFNFLSYLQTFKSKPKSTHIR